MAVEFINAHYLSILIAIPLLLAAVAPLVPEGRDGKNLHIFGVLGAAVLFLFSALDWNGWLHPATEMMRWIPSLGITYSLGEDGLSRTLTFLTTFLLLMATVASISSI